MRSSLTMRRMRAVQLIIALAMLAVPASALAFSGSAVAGQTETTPIKLTVSPGKVRFGHPVRVTGSAPATDRGRRVILLTAASSQSTWRQIAVTRATRTGRFAFRIVPRTSGLLRAAIPGATPATPTTGEATAGIANVQTAQVRALTVKARFAVPATPHAIVGSTHRVRVGGKLLPAVSGRLVQLQGHTAQGWHTVAQGRTGRHGSFRLAFTPHGATGQSLRVLFNGDARNARSAQSAGTVNALHPVLASWYNDAGTTGCGFHAGLGVANKTLPCGTHVTLSYGGRTVTAVVDDRGPYVAGREFDLNQNTAAALGFSGVGTVWSSIG